MRRGFTLIEMLVATALVMLIMILFAEIFQEAVGTVRAQRGLIANDEKARGFMTTLGNDLARRTYRTSVARGSLVTNVGVLESPVGLVALGPGDRVDPRQQGFFYYSENDPTDDGDDVLSLTVSVGETLRNPLISDPSQALYTGRALDANILGLANLNQPDLDDGRVDSSSASRDAVVTYFLRGTTLYRRVQLLRDPMPNASPPFGTQPTIAVTGAPAFPNFPNQYRDFDFAVSNTNPPPGRLHFHGRESLDNARGQSNQPIAMPWARFGHLPGGQPREFDSGGAYFGRFTHEETSFEGPNGLPPGFNGFRWPGFNDGPGNNIIDSPLVLSPAGVAAIDSNTNGTFEAGTDVLLSGTRAGEDILMTGVETFNVEVWDPGFGEGDFDGSGAFDPLNPVDDLNMNGVQDSGAWVDLGNATGSGLFTEQWIDRTASGGTGNNSWGRQNSVYGPAGPTGNHVFDTWHPEAGIDFDGDGIIAANERQSPPYRPLQVALPNGFFWQPNVAVGVGSVFMPDVFGVDGAPGIAGVDDDGNSTTDFAGPGVPDQGEIGFNGSDDNRSIGFVAIESVANTGARQPEWPREPGALVRDGGVLWQCFDNRVGLEKIRVTIRFRDPGSGQARQVSLIHAFTE